MHLKRVALLCLFFSYSSSLLLTDGWKACRSSSSSCIENVSLPITAFELLLSNGSFFTPAPAHAVITDPFVDDVLSFIPDIAVTGPEFYSFSYNLTIATATIEACAFQPFSILALVILSIEQSSYRLSAFLDAEPQPIPPIGNSAGSTEAVGMFKRHDFVLGSASTFCGSPTHTLSLLVLPPDNYGNATKSCYNESCGQGGNHAIAQDLVSQDTLGWDWVQAVPDRNTGILDPVSISIASVGILLRDPAVAVLNLTIATADPYTAQSLFASFRVSVLNAAAEGSGGGCSGSLGVSIPDLGLDFTWNVSIPPSTGGGWVEVDSPVVALSNVSLWWPHTMGSPTLYNATMTFLPSGAARYSSTGKREGTAPPPTQVSWSPGFRQIQSYIDESMGGRAFTINGGNRLYLQGGNFIATDQFSRAQYRGAERYGDEVRLHAEMGINALRLWGGHGGHAQPLFAAADAWGVLIFQEFWMSGDNNGRWAGNYSWPLDHALYNAAVEDTVRGLRGHPSLLLYCGGNEIFPLNASPPTDILAALLTATAQLDPNPTPFTQTSMGSDANYTHFNASAALAPSDGNYGLIDERVFFQRNPGMGPKAENLSIAFQPEIGNAAAPEFESLARFLSPPIRESIPPPFSIYNESHPVWQWHNYIPFTEEGAGAYDHVWRFAPRGTSTPPSSWNASEYSYAAGLAQVLQYQALFEGFQDAMWAWYGAIFMWKSASPWPALRGSLYDWYLATSGGYWGVKAALGGRGAAFHVQLNRANNSITLINKGIVDSDAAFGAEKGLLLRVFAWDITTGDSVPLNGGAFQYPIGTLAPTSSLHLQGDGSILEWPTAAPPNATLLWRLLVSRSGDPLATPPLFSNEYLLDNLSLNVSDHAIYAQVAAARAATPLPSITASAQALLSENAGLIDVNVTLTNNASLVALAILVTIRCPAEAVTSPTGYIDDRLLPQYASRGYFNLIPGETAIIRIEAPIRFQYNAQAFNVGVRGWNVQELNIPIQVLGDEEVAPVTGA